LPTIDNFLEVIVDGDSDGLPDPGEQAGIPDVTPAQGSMLLSAYPSPSKSVARVSVVLGGPSAGGRSHYGVRADVFDIAGRRVRTAYDGSLPAGRHVLSWDGRTVADAPAGAGIYFMRITADGEEIGTVKIIRIP
jgi:hypothetical protein